MYDGLVLVRHSTLRRSPSHSIPEAQLELSHPECEATDLAPDGSICQERWGHSGLEAQHMLEQQSRQLEQCTGTAHPATAATQAF